MDVIYGFEYYIISSFVIVTMTTSITTSITTTILVIIMARRAIPMIAFPRVRTIYIYIYIYIFLCHLREYALYT